MSRHYPYFVLLCMTFMLTITIPGYGQLFSHEQWKQNNLVTVKASQLYYEVNVGVNLRQQRTTADFVYVAFGYGKPTKKNAWRKFLPEISIPEGLSQEVQQQIRQSGTDDVHAGKIGLGWNHWFNHTLGIYAQAGWGFIADLSTSSNLPEDVQLLLENENGKSTFVYNTVPVEVGLTLNLWKHYHAQAGVTYMWKEIPLLTVGLGYAF